MYASACRLHQLSRRGDGGLTYLVLGLTADFKEFMYPPHCRLFFIINSTGICEDQHAQDFLPQLIPDELPAPMIDAHLMRHWIRYILPTGQALKGGFAELEALQQKLMADLMGVINLAPPDLAAKVDGKAVFRDWVGGFPGTIDRPLDYSVPRMNGLPVTPFIENILINYLAEMQANALRERGAQG